MIVLGVSGGKSAGKAAVCHQIKQHTQSENVVIIKLETDEDISDKIQHLSNSQLVIIYGTRLFRNQSNRDLMDLKVFVDVDSDIRLSNQGVTY
jgi:uridine kinase